MGSSLKAKSNSKSSAEGHSDRAKNFYARLLTITLGFPLVIILIFLAPNRYYWPLMSLVLIASVFSTIEAASLLKLHKVYNVRDIFQKLMLIFIGLAFPLISFFWVLGVLSTAQIMIFQMLVFMLIMFMQVFFRQENLKRITHAVCLHITLAVYPGLFIAHLIMISALPSASYLYLVMLIAIIANDTTAYISGQIYRRYHNHPTPLSPNKTMIGFIVGFIFSPISLLVYYRFAPEFFPGGQINAVILGVMLGFGTIFGDLIESGLKRSVKKKDSGEIIPGRGGLLDSIDSIIYTAPIFFYGYQLLNDVWVM